MKTPEEELQDRILNGKDTSDFPESDVKAYHMIFRALPGEQSYELPGGFADKLSARLAASGKPAPSKDLFWLAASLAGLTGVLVLTFMITRYKIDLGFLGTYARYYGILALGVILIFLVQYFDLKLIRLKFR